MDTTTLMIQNMVCDRCVKSVRQTLSGLGLSVRDVELGKAMVDGPLSMVDRERVDAALRVDGFALVRSRHEQIAEQARVTLIRYMAALEEGENPGPVQEILSRSLHLSPSALGRIFRRVHGESIQKHLIHLKIERAKELVTHDDLTVSDIAWKLGYSSPQHLSTQFKLLTGKTIREWKDLPGVRYGLDTHPQIR